MIYLWMAPLHCKAKLRPGRTRAKEKDSDLIHTPERKKKCLQVLSLIAAYKWVDNSVYNFSANNRPAAFEWSQ